MASPFTLQNEFLGMQQDSPRDQLPSGALWNCVDFIPQYLGAPLRGRGPANSYYTIPSSTKWVVTLFSGTLGGGSVNMAGMDDGNYYTHASSSALGVGGILQNPFLHRTGTTPLAIIPGSTPKSYDGTTYQSLAGSPPGGIYGDVWNDRSLLANSSGNPQRIWFSPVGDAAGTWDTTNSWLDTKTAITGVAAIRTGIMVFHQATTGLITGTTPPSATTIGDLTFRDPAFDVGCLGPQTIAKYNDTVIWADQRGIYQSDGNTIKDLTAAGGMSTYWRGIAPSSPNFIVGGHNSYCGAGIIRDTYVISLSDIFTNAVPNIVTSIDFLCYDLIRGFWYRMSNIPATCFYRDPTVAPEELAWGDVTNNGNVGMMSSVFNPSSYGSYGSASYETAYYRGWQHWHRKWIPSMSIQSWRRVYLNHYLSDTGSAGDISIGFATELGSSSYTNVSPDLMSPTPAYPNATWKRQHRNVFHQGKGIQFKVSATANKDIQLGALEVEYTPLETSRLDQ